MLDFARRPNGRILADLLAQQERLPLDVCLRYATEIASELRELHQDGRAHGSLDAEHVVLRGAGASLLPPERRRFPDPLGDIAGFGEVLYAMLTGKTAQGDEFRVVPAKPGILKGPEAIRAAASRVAERCLMADRESAPDLQKILTEVRLLHVMAKQFSAEQLALHVPPLPASYPPPQPLDVYAGKVAPNINPPGGPPAAPAAPPQPDADKPGEHSPQTRRAKGSHSRPILKDVACPKCKGFHVRLSRPRTTFERFLNLLGFGVYRCHRCFYRYVPLFGRKIARHEG